MAHAPREGHARQREPQALDHEVGLHLVCSNHSKEAMLGEVVPLMRGKGTRSEGWQESDSVGPDRSW